MVARSSGVYTFGRVKWLEVPLEWQGLVADTHRVVGASAGSKSWSQLRTHLPPLGPWLLAYFPMAAYTLPEHVHCSGG